MPKFPLIFLVALPCASCLAPSAAVQAGYMQVAMSGDVALSQAFGNLTAGLDQDIESGLGLGQDQANAYLRGELDMGSPVLTVSGFQFSEQGTGTLDAQYGNIAAGTDVVSDVSFMNVKSSLAFEIGAGPFTIAPGIAVDVFDLELFVRDTVGVATERVDVLAPVPMGFLRAEFDAEFVGAVAEFGYVTTPRIQDIEGTFWDAELLVEVRPTPLLHLFAGYRHIHMDGDGTADDREFAIDLDVAGWLIGGGLRF